MKRFLYAFFLSLMNVNHIPYLATVVTLAFTPQSLKAFLRTLHHEQ